MRIIKNIWIMNHYATNMFFDKAGRHYWFAKNLINDGYNVTIFCASTNHFSNEEVSFDKEIYKTEYVDSIRFVFIKVPPYQKNGFTRVYNMVSFYRRLKKVVRKYFKNEKPDVILSSSVHPLTLIAGNKLSKEFGVPSICEVRDLWPESIVAYGKLGKRNPLTKLMYWGEKWIYKNADSIIMTWKGGKQYIIDKGWDKEIDINKVHHISNGIVIEDFDKSAKQNVVVDQDLSSNKFTFVYTGSIREVNNLGMLVDTAKIVQEMAPDIKILVFGDGNQKERLVERCKNESIHNIEFKGRIKKNQVPYVVSNAFATILHNTSTSLDKYGQSQNKLFEYLAAGRPIIQTYESNYNVVKEMNCGLVVKNQTPQEIAEAMVYLTKNIELAEIYANNARMAAQQYDFRILTDKLIKVINNV